MADMYSDRFCPDAKECKTCNFECIWAIPTRTVDNCKHLALTEGVNTRIANKACNCEIVHGNVNCKYNPF